MFVKNIKTFNLATFPIKVNFAGNIEDFMKHVSLKSIEKAIDKVDNLDDAGLEKVSETFALAQQDLLGYLMSAALEYKNEKLEGLIIYYFCLISEAFQQEQIICRAVVNEDIDELEEPFLSCWMSILNLKMRKY